MFKQNICFEVWGGEAGKYRLRDHDGNPVENTPEETCQRVAHALAALEAPELQEHWYNQFMTIMGGKFAGGGRIMANAGAAQYKKEVSPINCTVMRQIPDSMAGIMDVLKDAALSLKAGCGVGYDFSTIRPSGAHVFGAGAATSGVISFMKIFDASCATVMSGGGRRGAQMTCMDISHPEIESFIEAKRQDGVLRYFNMSILITDSFMNAVENDAPWNLWFWEKTKLIAKDVPPSSVKLIAKDGIPFSFPDYNYFTFAADHVEVLWGNTTTDVIFQKKSYKTIPARQIFDLVMKSTYNFAEPGFILIDRINKDNNLYFCETIRATNPCVTGDTRLATQYGLVTMKELYDSQAPLEVTVDNRVYDNGFGTTLRPAVPVFMTAHQAQVYKVTTDRGYEIKATEWHKFFTGRGRLHLHEMQVGDVLPIQSGKGQFGQRGSKELGEIIGWITGDGHIKSDGMAVLNFWGEDRSMASRFAQSIGNITSKMQARNGRKYGTSTITAVDSRDMDAIKSTLLARHLNDNYNFNASNKLRVPEVVFQGTEDCVKGYLQALFQADGTVNINERNSHARVALSSSAPDLLKDVQLLLGNFGITSTINLRRKAHSKMMPDGKGGSKMYACKDQYELFITSGCMFKFEKEIGFMLPAKTNKLNGWTSQREHYQQLYTATVTSIEPCGVEAVYDTTQSDGNAITLNNVGTCNCGEQPLAPLASCLLGSMILPAYVKDEFTPTATIDLDRLYDDVLIASRALDNVVEVNNLPLPEMQEQILLKRRHGLGITGLGSLLNMIGFRYGSNESVALAGKISHTIALASLEANIQLAQEKGPAPIFQSMVNRLAVTKSGYMSRLLASLPEGKCEEITAQILEFGLRYSHATSIAPTGTMSLTWGNNCSNGLEPVFANSYMRNIRQHGKKTKTQDEVMDYAYYLWKEKNGDMPLPSYWSVTDNLSVMDHVNMQSAIQEWCDSSISKTINVPTDYPFEDFKKVYIEGWKRGLKGVTTFRFNPEAFSGVLVQKKDLEATEYTFTLEDGSEITVNGSETIEYDGEMHNAANLFDALKEGIYGNM
jgi:ribonucleoside-diphosphate reductase alpha chain